MDALRAGKHVLVEKPMALSVEEVGDIGSLAKEKSVVAMVGHTFLYSPAVRYVKQLVDSGELGNILYVYAQRLNWGIVRPDVNALWSLGVHDISIIQYWLGDLSEPASISKTGVDFIKSGIEDVVFLNIVYPDNLMINIHVSWLDHHKTRRITVVGTRKMVVYDNMAEKKISIFDNGDVAQPEIEQKEPLKEEIKHFIDCIANGSKCLTDTEHAKKVIKTLSRAK
jgi:predicted dehydrogenase